MSYEVLARKWRPQTFDEVVGQDHITRTLKKAVELGRLSHAYLFSGPRGCGKTSTARILAKVINCTNLADGNPCDKCASCVGVIQGKNLDVMEIDGASHTGIGEVRDLQESIGYVPSQFKNKIYIIDEVHMLSTHAFNALLKTLEEPPAHVYFVFATTSPHKIPDTIKSRCQRHQFKRLEIRDITDHLERICKAEKVKCETDALRLLARKAEGSMRDGQSLLDQCITASSGEVLAKTVRDVLGLLDQEMVLGFLETVAKGDPTAVLRELDNAVREGVDLEELLNGLIEGYRDLMLLAVPGDLSELVFRSSDELESFRQVLTSYELPDIVTIVERLCNVAPRLKMASDPRILLESVLVDLALLDRQTEIRELIERIEEGGTETEGKSRTAAKAPSRKRQQPRGTEQSPVTDETSTTADVLEKPMSSDHRDLEGVEPLAPAADARSEETAPLESARIMSTPTVVPSGQSAAKDLDLASLDFASLRQLWDGFVTYVRQKKAILGVSLISGTLQSIEKNVVTLRFAKGFSFQKNQVESEANAKFLKGVAKKYFGRDLKLVCESAEDENVKTRRNVGASATTTGGKKAPRGIDAQPMVKKILEEFDGEIVRYGPQ
ncbi:MAG: DNA polymerase III subunit gamma/tau [Candidatus Latescibacterota bacterium]|nr:MAG: DNA polymerase III subunit gamma/tau [Candidatus Latescibacterota bacterium]